MSLSSWGQIIEEQAEESRRKDEERLAGMRAAMPSKMEEAKEMDDHDLLLWYTHCSQSINVFHTAEREIWEELMKHSYALIIERMQCSTN